MNVGVGDKYIRGVSYEQNHAGSVCSSEFSHDPRPRVELCCFCVIDQECSSREDDGIIAQQDREKGEHDIEIKVQPPSIGTTLVADPKRSGLEDTGDVEGYGHVREREKEDEDIVRLDTFCAYDAVANDRWIKTLGGPE